MTDFKETAFLHNLVCTYLPLVSGVGRLREKLGNNEYFGFSVAFLLFYDLGHIKN